MDMHEAIQYGAITEVANMRIYKNNASINMSLDEFLEFLEEETFDNVLSLLEELDEKGSMVQDLDPEMNEYFSGMSEEDFYQIESIGEDMFNMMAGADPDLLDDLALSNEDIKVRDIVSSFFFIEDMQ
jgi:hypothetical protein